MPRGFGQFDFNPVLVWQVLSQTDVKQLSGGPGLYIKRAGPVQPLRLSALVYFRTVLFNSYTIIIGIKKKKDQKKLIFFQKTFKNF